MSGLFINMDVGWCWDIQGKNQISYSFKFFESIKKLNYYQSQINNCTLKASYTDILTTLVMLEHFFISFLSKQKIPQHQIIKFLHIEQSIVFPKPSTNYSVFLLVVTIRFLWWEKYLLYSNRQNESSNAPSKSRDKVSH